MEDHHLATSDETIVRALDLERGRASGVLTWWDGDLSALSGQSRWLRLVERPVLSATSLQTWATCPFRYFAGQVLRLGSLERPEELTMIPALDRGALVHAILEQFIRRVQEEDTLPAAGEPWKEEHRVLLRDIAREAVRGAEERGVTGKRLFWEMEQEAILADLDNFLEEDARLREQYGVTPHQLEMRFGSGPGNHAPAVWEAPGLGTLRFRGVIDRLDLDASGRSALVLDYKTGGAGFYSGLAKDPVDRGKCLQLPIYALAVRQALGKGVDVRAAYWFTSARGGFSLLPPQAVSLAEVEKPFGEAVAVIAGSILQGLFPANPGQGEQNCRYCDFKSLCAVRREVYWERKQADPRLAAYVNLATRESLIEADQ
jgi:ATP-dependent helicase/nuclease subunit B